MEKVVKKAEYLMKDIDGIMYYNRELYEKECQQETVDNAVKEHSFEIAKKMLSKNKPIEEIQEFTELSKEEINNLRNN